jgi:gamma-glutamylcyclotransferase (GGCT)/AIG2-like uncharacterized protein YtfP
MSLRLFVYGTLRSDILTASPEAQAACRLLRRAAVPEGAATVRGRLYSLGPYPAFAQGGRTRVAGEVWRIRNPAVLAALDRYEGPAYARKPTRVRLRDGRSVTAFVYVCLRGLQGVPRIASGDYLEWIRNAR